MLGARIWPTEESEKRCVLDTTLAHSACAGIDSAPVLSWHHGIMASW
jgi:hypothetical protein